MYGSHKSSIIWKFDYMGPFCLLSVRKSGLIYTNSLTVQQGVSWLLSLIFSWSLLIENTYLLLIVCNMYFICFLPQVEYKRGHEERVSKFTSVVDTPDILHAKAGGQLSSDVSETKQVDLFLTLQMALWTFISHLKIWT